VPHRPDRRVLIAIVAAAVLAAAAAVVLASGPSTPSTVEGYYVGRWRVSGEMVRLHGGRVVPAPAVPPGLVEVGETAGGLTVSLQGFPGVPSTPAPAVRDPLRLAFTSPDAGQGAYPWSITVSSTGSALLLPAIPGTDGWGAGIPLRKL
jgi:hypothetical protein